jgi:hypothetical protein
MRPTLIDATVGGTPLLAQYVRLSPYASNGSYTSAVFDAGGVVSWMTATWASTVPTGTTVAVKYRTGSTPTPDASWTAFAPVGANGALTGTTRYFQFMVVETTSDTSQTPVVKDVTLAFKR